MEFDLTPFMVLHGRANYILVRSPSRRTLKLLKMPAMNTLPGRASVFIAGRADLPRGGVPPAPSRGFTVLVCSIGPSARSVRLR